MSKTGKIRFFRRVQVFVKRNALALLIGFTTVLTLGVIALSAYHALNVRDLPVSEQIEKEVVVPTGSNDPIIFENPVENVNISKEYAADHLLQDKTTGIWQTHQAVDFACADGAEAKAVYSGTIESVVNSMMDGTIVTLKINDKLKVVYKSLSEAYVESGDKIATGAKLGKVGTNVTEKAEGVHLHLELYEDGKLVDPGNYLAFDDK